MKAVLSVLFFLAIQCAFGQKYQLLKLKNGSEVIGQFVDIDSSHTRIKTKDGSIWSFNNTEIATIEEFIPKVSGKGVFIRAESGILGGSQISPSVLITNGYAFNAHWSTGLMLGYEFYWGENYIPLILSGRYNLLNRGFTPFVECLAGYEMPVTDFDDNKGGVTTGARAGITKYIGNRFAFSTSIGYRFAYLKEINGWWDDNVTFREINRFELKFALTFQ